MSEILTFGPVEFIRGEKNGRYPYCNSIYIPDAGILIDPSSDRDYLSKLAQKGLKEVWLTHWHEDHIMHLDLFTDYPLAMHELDAPPLADLFTFIQWYGIDEKSQPKIFSAWKELLVEVFNYQPRKVDRFLSDNEQVNAGSLTVEVIHTPGHSPGNLAFYFKEAEILYLGDNDLTSFGPWYGDRYSNIDEIINSISKLRKIPAKLWLAGHEEGVFEENPEELWDQYEQVIYTREQKLLDFLSESRTLQEIAEQWFVYGKPVEPVEEYLMIELISMKKHADRLIERGLVVKDGEYYQMD